MRPMSRVAAAAALLIIVAAITPSAALAKPSEESCAAYRAIPFSLKVPDALRTVGTHRFEWFSTFTFEGQDGEALAQNQVTIDPGAEAYPNTVLLRRFSNTTLLPNGDVGLVDAIRPDQAAQLYLAAFSLKDDHVFLDSFRTWFRYEIEPDVWTPFVELDRGPATSFCNQVTRSVWTKAYGWD